MNSRFEFFFIVMSANFPSRKSVLASRWGFSSRNKPMHLSDCRAPCGWGPPPLVSCMYEYMAVVFDSLKASRLKREFLGRPHRLSSERSVCEGDLTSTTNAWQSTLLVESNFSLLTKTHIFNMGYWQLLFRDTSMLFPLQQNNEGSLF